MKSATTLVRDYTAHTLFQQLANGISNTNRHFTVSASGPGTKRQGKFHPHEAGLIIV